MVRRSEPGLFQWLVTTIIIAIALLFIYFLIQYSNARAYMPSGMLIAGIDVSGYDSEGARQRLSERYLEAPIVIRHGDNLLELSPERDADLKLQIDEMILEAERKRDNLDYWAGFWGFMFGRPIEVEAVELRAVHDRTELRSSLEQIRGVYDIPAQPPQPVPATLSFLYGDQGLQTNVEKSLNSIEGALYRPVNREATLILEPIPAPRPNINLLGSLIVNHMQVFNGAYSVHILDPDSGDEFSVNADLPMSGNSQLKLPIAIETLRVFGNPPEQQYLTLIEEMLLEQGDQSADQLLDLIAGESGSCEGPAQVTEMIQKLGLINTFIVTPYESLADRCPETLETPANTTPGYPTVPTPSNQTTAREISALYLMLYDCANKGGGTLVAVFNGDVSQSECEFILSIMQKNRIGSLIEEGIPPETPIAHRHGWISDTHADAGIVYSENGDYIIVIMLYNRDWLEWSVSSPLIADISQATYNYFNFDNPFLTN